MSLRSWWVLGSLVSCVIASTLGCADEFTTGPAAGGEAAGGAASGGAPAGGATAGGAGPGDGGPGGGGPGDCTTMVAQVYELLVLAKECSGADQCGPDDVVDGPCCPELVADGASVATHDYTTALLAAQEAGCPFNCTTAPCPEFSDGGYCPGFNFKDTSPHTCVPHPATGQ